jgi:hypothetical protein
MLLAIFSANVLPKHILMPPRKGTKLMGCLLFPEGVKKYLLSGSNLSGINSSGECHYSGFF